MALDLKQLEKNLDDALAMETTESLNEWLSAPEQEECSAYLCDDEVGPMVATQVSIPNQVEAHFFAQEHAFGIAA